MALAFTLNFTIRDQKGKESTSKLRLPSTLSITQITGFATQALQVIANANTGQIVNAGVSVGLDLNAATLNTIVNVFADIAEKAMFTFNSAITGLFARFKIPTWDETNTVLPGTDQIDLAHVDVAALIAAAEDGVTLTDTTVIQPVDKYGNDLVSVNTDREIFQRKR